MKVLIAFLATLLLMAPASAGPLDDLPISGEKAQQLLTRAAEELDLKLPSEVLTQGQREVFSEMTFSKEMGQELAGHLLQAALKGDATAALPQLLGRVTPEQQDKLRLSGQQSELLFAIFQRLQK